MSNGLTNSTSYLYCGFVDFFISPSTSSSVPTKSPTSRASVDGLQETYTILSILLLIIASITFLSHPFLGGSKTTQTSAFSFLSFAIMSGRISSHLPR